jgi:hypothetical protein
LFCTIAASPARAPLDEEWKRPLHLLEPAGVAEKAARVAAIAESPRRLRQAIRLSEHARTVGSSNRFGVRTGDAPRVCELGIGRHERRPGGLLLEQLDGLRGERDMAAFAEAQGEGRAELERPCRGLGLAPPAQQRQRALERLRRLARASDLENRFRPADEQLRSVGVVRGH